MLLTVTSLAFAALAGTAPTASARISHAVVVDSGAEAALTADQLTKYVAMKKELPSFWKDPKNATFSQTAQSYRIDSLIHIGSRSLRVNMYDYPTLTKQNAALAALFTKNHFAPEKFAPTQLAILQSVGLLTLAETEGKPLPASSTVLGKNTELVKAHRAELTAAGISVTFPRSDAGGGNLNP